MNQFEEAETKAKDAGDCVKGAAAELRQEAGARVEQAYGQVRKLRDDGEEYVRQNPRECLLAALALGFVTGLLIRR